MKIAVFSDTFHPAIDGVVSCMDTIARELLRRGHAVRFFVPQPKDKTSVEMLARDLDVCWLRGVGLWTYENYRIVPPFSAKAWRAFKAFGSDIVHVHSPCTLGLMGMRYARRTNQPVVATYHTLMPEFLKYLPIPWFRDTPTARRMTWRYTAWFYNRADVVTTPTQAMACELQAHHGRQATVLSNPIRFSLFHQFAATPRPTDVFRMVFFGRVSYEKRIDVVVEALRLLVKRGRTVELWLIGSGPAEKALRRQVEILKLQEQVRFLGVLRDEELARQVASCHCLVTASTIETQGLTILEAMSAGLPCVGADCRAIPRAIHDNKNGFLFAPDRADLAADRIEQLIQDASLQETLAAHAVDTARQHATETVVDKYEGLYQRLIDGQSGSGNTAGPTDTA